MAMQIVDRQEKSVQQRFVAAREQLAAMMIDREDEIDVLLTAIVAGEHAMLVGPTGTGKTMLARSVLDSIENRWFFSLTRLTSLAEMAGECASRFHDSEVVVFDNLTQPSNEVLVGLTQAIELRRSRSQTIVAVGREWSVPATQDEWQELCELFLLRKEVKPIDSPSSQKRLLWDRPQEASTRSPFSRDELRIARDSARRTPWSSDARTSFEKILQELRKANVRPSDRRLHKTIAAVQAFAYICDADMVATEHLDIVRHTLWTEPVHEPRFITSIISEIATTVGKDLAQLQRYFDWVLGNICLDNPRTIGKATTLLMLLKVRLGHLHGYARGRKLLDEVEAEHKRLVSILKSQLRG